MLVSQLESILFVASKPLGVKKLAKALNVSAEEVLTVVTELRAKYNVENSGVVIVENNDEYQMVASPDNQTVAENFIKAEVSGELTRPQLETLTVISYCGPITKPELEQIRGVNCALILRNLMMRGLVKERDDATNLLPTYEVTMDYLRRLGLNSLHELPDYATLHNHEYLTAARATQPTV
ncbi:MAG: SMC-Scp complex subunit ScpB [Candidatus Magasanikbacteria bacterium RIFOXYC2_FULL_42_28]|uniref:SMC-Scp complex subunit ScpB n=1 Tax=Candidatus Magasanikbacteria bacterium RIFOXYC2_FULL_42_28 TaxID=1798704 RepID=A0A1F6NXZ6_9BACT|nr:MAG: SMC-Scp complex subunit ScpB [Candidatus Magasanikbacteria bacterium RIFOXYC2_FULL_42_28]